MLDSAERSAVVKRQDYQQSNPKQRLSAPDLENAINSSPTETKKHQKKDKGFMKTIAGSKPKIRKALGNLISRNMSSSSMNT